MSDELTAERFIEALRRAESQDDVDDLVALFAEDAACGNGIGNEGEVSGTDGVREFWEQDRELFAGYTSEFQNAVEDGSVIALEWTRSSGDGNDFGGVSVIEHSDGKVDRFCAYFDPGAAG